jgi:hypothetical protein
MIPLSQNFSPYIGCYYNYNPITTYIPLVVSQFDVSNNTSFKVRAHQRKIIYTNTSKEIQRKQTMLAVQKISSKFSISHSEVKTLLS